MKPARKINPWNIIAAELDARSSTPDQLGLTYGQSIGHPEFDHDKRMHR